MTSPQTEASADAARGVAAEVDRDLTITRHYPAPIDAVFRAWTDPAQLVQWWGPEGMSVPVCEMDVRVGGQWRTCMTSPDGAEHWVEGTYREISEPERLVFTWSWDQEDGSRGHETLVTVEFEAKDGGTEMRLTHALFQDAEACRLHHEGWASSFVCLDTHIAGG